MWYFAWYLRNLSFSSFERDFKLQREGGVASWKQHLQAPNSHPDTALKSRDQSKTLIFNIPQILVNFLCLHEVLYTCHICLLVLKSTLHLSLLWSEHEELKPQVTFSAGSSQWEAMAGEEDARVSLSLSLLWAVCAEVTVSSCSLLLLSCAHSISSSPQVSSSWLPDSDNNTASIFIFPSQVVRAIPEVANPSSCLCWF